MEGELSPGSTSRRIVARALLVLLTTFVAVGCLGFDHEFDVNNAASTTYLIRVPLGSPYPGKYYVVSVDVGASGPALGWYGPLDVPIEVITSDCQVISTFERSSDGTYVAPGISGLTGTVEPYSGVGYWNNPAI